MKDIPTLRREVLEELGDPEGNTWSPEEIDRYLDEGQKRFVELTGVLRTRAPLTAKENQSIYALPEDHVFTLKYEDINGNEIQRTTSKWLEREVSTNFRDSTIDETPSYAYSDLAGDGFVEFWPRLNPSIETAGITFSNGTLVPKLFNPNIVCIRVQGSRLYVLTTTVVEVYQVRDDNIELESSITHSETVVANNSDMQIGITTDELDDHGSIYFSDNVDSIFRIDTTGAKTTFLSGLGGKVKVIAPFTNGQTIVWVETDGSWHYSDIVTPSDTTAALSGLSGVPNDVVADPRGTNFIYVANATSGIHVIETFGTPSVQTDITTNDVDTVAAFTDGTNHRIYYYDNDDDTTKYYDLTAATITDISITNSTSTGTQDFMVSDGGTDMFRLSGNTIDTGTNTRISGSWTKIVDDADAGVFYASALGVKVLNTDYRRVAVIDGMLIWYSTFSDLLHMSATELGELVYLDGAPFDQEEGLVTDLTGNENTLIKITGDETGTVSMLTSSKTAAMIYYVREPLKGTIEIVRFEALKEWAKYRAYLKRGDRASLSLSKEHKTIFQRDYVDREVSKAVSGFNNNTTGSVAYNY